MYSSTIEIIEKFDDKGFEKTKVEFVWKTATLCLSTSSRTLESLVALKNPLIEEVYFVSAIVKVSTSTKLVTRIRQCYLDHKLVKSGSFSPSNKVRLAGFFCSLVHDHSCYVHFDDTFQFGVLSPDTSKILVDKMRIIASSLRTYKEINEATVDKTSFIDDFWLNEPLEIGATDQSNKRNLVSILQIQPQEPLLAAVLYALKHRSSYHLSRLEHLQPNMKTITEFCQDYQNAAIPALNADAILRSQDFELLVDTELTREKLAPGDEIQTFVLFVMVDLRRLQLQVTLKTPVARSKLVSELQSKSGKRFVILQIEDGQVVALKPAQTVLLSREEQRKQHKENIDKHSHPSVLKPKSSSNRFSVLAQKELPNEAIKTTIEETPENTVKHTGNELLNVLKAASDIKATKYSYSDIQTGLVLKSSQYTKFELKGDKGRISTMCEGYATMRAIDRYMGLVLFKLTRVGEAFLSKRHLFETNANIDVHETPLSGSNYSSTYTFEVCFCIF